MNSSDQQPSFKNHPNGTASFCFRVKTSTGAKWQAWTHQPKPIRELIRMIETEYLDYLRTFAAAEEAKADAARFTPSDEGTADGSAEDPSLSLSFPDPIRPGRP